MHTEQGILTSAEIAAYRRDGFVVPHYRLTGPPLARLQRLAAKLIADNPGLVDGPITSPHVPGSGTEGVKGDCEWREVATQPELLDIVEQVIGPDIILWGTTMFYKKPNKGPVTPWHRDGFAWPITPLETTSIWIAAYDSKVENGCLRCIPGSHNTRRLGEHDRTRRDGQMFAGDLDPGEYDEGTARDIELEAGQMVVFDVYTVHGARANQGTIGRAGYALRFMPGGCFYNHDYRQDSDEPGFSHGSRPLMLVRGEDRTHRNNFRRGHPAVAA